MGERELTVTAKALGENEMLGLRVGWINGGGENGITFSLDAGAGVGSSALSLLVQRDGVTVAREVIDIRDLAQQWVAAIMDEQTADDLDRKIIRKFNDDDETAPER